MTSRDTAVALGVIVGLLLAIAFAHVDLKRTIRDRLDAGDAGDVDDESEPAPPDAPNGMLDDFIGELLFLARCRG